ncbi:transcriptional regulator [Aeromicrobium sp. 636]|uniref:Helix-turn-helix transcriptional regulator n=1 Tax=Aeromicrobium senzhongii TaxID=2663859 RepID=A0A8I0K1X3_9ACTN|nr:MULTISPECIES: helix-turn-helix domain-containing protein [Aeromicrobium]MBC9227483.1 helix-turn-helix transcriptional regulator [Aeromicrobium senzhongii]MCQ3999580.1 transcriptional regulator [Aeromicrobium sp. 636]
MTAAITDENGASPLGRALILLGDMWTLRIVMWVFNGKRRFQDLRNALSISDPVLSRRLNSLVDEGILEAREYQTNPPRREYVLTEAGLDLWQVLVAMWVWDRRWAGHHHRDAQTRLRHLDCGHHVRPVFGCGACGAIGVGARDVRGTVDDRLLLDSVQRRSRRSPTMTTPIDATGVLGDRWSTFLLSDAFTGTRRFNDFQENLGISPVTLTQRLHLFVEAGMMSREDIAGGKRQEYRLTSKALDFFDVTTTINGWAQRWLTQDGRSGLNLVHIPCENEFVPQFTCNACNGVLNRTNIRFEGPIPEL